ncbi:non-canonical purine NTP pyrophosphatase [Nannocystaceae bacterium ST9]
MAIRLVIASHNLHKVAELRELVQTASLREVRAVSVTSLTELARELGPAPEVDETATSFAGNAVLKAEAIAAWLRARTRGRETDVVVADDSGLCVDALDGAPGVWSARFAGPKASDEQNNLRLVAELGLRGLDRSPAEYACVLAVRYVGHRFFEFTLPEDSDVYLRDDCMCIAGRCRGEVRVERRGEGGFGYDPHFWIEGGARTFAELSRAEKSRQSHRGMAMRRLIDELPLML